VELGTKQGLGWVGLGLDPRVCLPIAVASAASCDGFVVCACFCLRPFSSAAVPVSGPDGRTVVGRCVRTRPGVAG
jgi:hypothetical protein